MTYGQTREEAISNTERLAIEVIADRIKHAELPASALNVSFRILIGRRLMLAACWRPWSASAGASSGRVAPTGFWLARAGQTTNSPYTM